MTLTVDPIIHKSFIEIESALLMSGQLVKTFQDKNAEPTENAREIIHRARMEARQWGLTQEMIAEIEAAGARKARL